MKKENLTKKINEEPEAESEGPSEEELKEIGENLRKYEKLARGMDANFDNIFEVAPENVKYAVGTYETIKGKEKPRIHYFENKHKKKAYLIQ